MKKFFLLAAALFAAGMLHAFEQSSYAPGVMISSVPGTKLTGDSFLAARPGKTLSGVVELNEARELVFRPEPGKKEAEFHVYLQLPAKVSRVKISFEIKGEDFFVSRKIKTFSSFSFYFGGVNMMLRGNAYGLRYYDIAKKTYVHGIPFRNGQWQSITVDMTCGAAPVYSLNEIKNIPQRGKCEWINRLNFSCKMVDATANTAIYIRNLKVELPDE